MSATLDDVVLILKKINKNIKRVSGEEEAKEDD